MAYPTDNKMQFGSMCNAYGQAFKGNVVVMSNFIDSMKSYGIYQKNLKRKRTPSLTHPITSQLTKNKMMSAPIK